MASLFDHIEIKNFKSIRHAKIEDCRRVNVFIGYPNVGKSNVIEALSLFSIDEPNFDFSKFVRMKGLTTLFYDGQINDQTEVRINDRHRIVMRFERDAILFQHQFEREGTSFQKNDAQKVFLDDSDDVSVKRRFAIKEEKRAIIDYNSTGIGRINELAEVRRYEFEKHINYSNKGYFTLSYPDGDNIFNIISTNSDLKKEVAELFQPYNLELLYDTRLQEFTILKRTQSGIFSIPYELIADTLQRLIFYKSAVFSNNEKILLFEEPEAHMFPPYISKFTSDVMYDKNKNQFFIATHSPFVLNDFMEDLEKEDLSIYAVGYRREAGETIIRRLADEEINEIYQYGIDLFFNLENFLKDAV
jgi:AAA15 family ATPase/GTPase